MALGNNSGGYLEDLPEKLVEYWAMLELDILRDMARKLRAAELYIPATEYQHRKLSLLGMMYNDILELLAGALGSTFDAIEEIITNEGINTLREEAGKYRTAAELGLLEAVPERKLGSVAGAVGAEELTEAQVRANIANLLENDDAEAQAIKQIIDAGIAKTEGTFSNLTSTTANTATQQFEQALDRAYMQVSTGAFSLEKAVNDAVEELAAQGIGSITYPSGRVDTVEVAVRRAVVTGTNQTSLKLREQFADEMECDLVEVSAHEGARPEHAEWQGKIYSRKGNDPKYPDFAASTGYGTGPGLGGWNCRHTFSAYFEGMPRAWSDEELEQLKNETVEYKGEQLPRYVAQQRMREMERNVRRYRREAAVADDERAAGFLEKEREARARYVDFCKETGLKEQPERFRVASSSDGLTGSGKDGNIKPSGDKIMSGITVPIEQRNTAKGNPNAMIQFGRPLNNRQQMLLGSLPEYDSRITLLKKNVSMKDLAALTAETGDEFAMFTKGSERLIIRGNQVSVNIDVEQAKELAAQGYRWSGHTHPGMDTFCLMRSDGDVNILKCFNQELSSIYNSTGKSLVFGKE